MFYFDGAEILSKRPFFQEPFLRDIWDSHDKIVWKSRKKASASGIKMLPWKGFKTQDSYILLTFLSNFKPSFSDHLLIICWKLIQKLITCFTLAGTTNPRWSELWFVETQRMDFQLYNQAVGNYFTKNVPRQHLPAGTRRRRAAASMTPLFSFFPIFAQTFRRYSTNFLWYVPY